MWVHREAFTYTYAVCVESRGQPWIPFLRSHSLLLEAGLLRGPRLTAPTKLPGIKPWDTKYTLPHWDFHMRTDLRSPRFTHFTWQTLHTLHYLLRAPNTTLRRFYTVALWKLINRVTGS